MTNAQQNDRPRPGIVIGFAVGVVAAVFAAGVVLFFLGGFLLSGAPVSDVTLAGFSLMAPSTPIQWVGVCVRWLGAATVTAGTLATVLIMAARVVAALSPPRNRS